MADYNAIDTKKMDRGSKSILEMKLEALPSWGQQRPRGSWHTGNSPRGVSGKRKRGRSATKHKKAKRSNKNKHSKNKRRYRSFSSSSSTEKSSPSPNRHKSRRKKRKHCKSLSSLSCSSSLSSFSESSETRSRDGSLGSRFQVISEEDKFRYNFPTDMAEYANTHFETYVKEADLEQPILTENPVPDNLDQVKKLDDFFARDILKDKRKQKDLDMIAHLKNFSRRIPV